MSTIASLRVRLIDMSEAAELRGHQVVKSCMDEYLVALDALISERDALQARVETAERERDDLREDKGRLDWLQTFTVRVDDVLRHFVCCDDVDIRASIDAAMRKEKL